MEGDKEKELGGGCKLIRSGDLKEDPISVSKRSDRVMSIKLGLEETLINIICAY